MRSLVTYLGQLPLGKRILWCYLIWYVSMLGFYFDPTLHIWLTSLGISVVIGFGLMLSVASGANTRHDFWTVARLFIMPFCVSSFSALVKDQGFVLILSPVLPQNLIALGSCGVFLLLCYSLRRAAVLISTPPQ
jgi:hypothetical protein